MVNYIEEKFTVEITNSWFKIWNINTCKWRNLGKSENMKMF
jgi:hypothetical protein